MSPPPWVSHRQQLSPRPEYAMRPRSRGAVPLIDGCAFLEAARYRACASRRACIRSALERCESPLTIGVHVNREPELGERPALFIAARPDAHVKEDIERFLVRQPAVLVNVID